MKKNLTISVVGLGYVGLPTAVAFHNAGYRVFGIDISSDVVKSVRSRRSHLVDSSSNLEIPPQSEVWKVSNDFSTSIPESDVILITVPTPVNPDRSPNLSIVQSAIKSVLDAMHDGEDQVIVVESTVFPGATMKIARQLEIDMGRDYPKDVKYAYSPERVSPGDEGRSSENIAKIVGANDSETGLLLAEMYSTITGKGCEYVGSIEVAEAAKMIENTQRDIDIAFINELAKILPAMGLDVMDVINAASTKWNFHRHSPGIGVGGHCIPVDPYYYIQSSKDAGIDSILSPSAREINESMPIHATESIAMQIQPGDEILILGLAYKPNVGDIRESPSLKMINELSNRGIKSRVWDPYVDKSVDLPIECEFVSDPHLAADGMSMIVLATAHPECVNLDWNMIREVVKTPNIYDGPRALDRSILISMGFDYFGVGVPNEENS